MLTPPVDDWQPVLAEQWGVAGEPVAWRTVENPLSICRFMHWGGHSFVVKQPTAHALLYSPHHLGALETAFYQHLPEGVSLVRSVPVPRFAAFDPDDGNYTLVLDDAGPGRYAPDRQLPPDRLQLQQMVQALAAVQGAFHGRTDFLNQRSVETFSLEDFENRWRQPILDYLPTFQQALGERLTNAQHRFLERLIDGSTARMAVLAEHDFPLTIVHSDPNPSNFLLPADGDSSPVLLDWQSWRPGPGVQDLCFLMGQFLPPALRERWEPQVLREYGDLMAAQGLGLAPQVLREHYRVLLCKALMMPILLHRYRNAPNIWWPQFFNALQACLHWQPL